MVFLWIFLAAAGVLLLIWCMLGVLLLPVFGPDMVTLCFSEGEGGDLEQKARAFGWLREGRLSGGRLVIVDCGLNETGLERAQLLRQRYHWVDYCPRPALEDYIEITDRCGQI